MNQAETALTATLTGEVAEWLQQEAERSTRTPSQYVMHVLTIRKQNSERSKQRAVERKAYREKLFGTSRTSRVGQQAA